ncbi:hypothetical protein M4D73_33970 [Streptomyces pseudogriseolus]|uniref:hypothetical protein n=1 Tax=Streptomyces pseudogriseolus TaxID=36817 RepID=UPI003FA300D0|nr:hypothetical protein [Streptomyces pseudogriseolus]
MRFLGRHRTAAWATSGILCFLTNTALRQTGVIDSFSAWGLLWVLPVLIVDRRFATVRREAEVRHIATLEAVLAERR